MKWTRKMVEELLAKGNIRGIVEKPAPAASKLQVKKVSKTKQWIAMNLEAWCSANKVELQTEYRFHDERKWRFDYAIPALRIAIEYEGLMSQKSRHTTVTGYTGDAEKYNAAQALGWKVLRYTAKNYKNIINDLNQIIK